MAVNLILKSSCVFTGCTDEALPLSIAIEGDRIIAVGNHEDIERLASENNDEAECEIRDFGDAMIVPGFHDSHLHFFHSALYASPLAETFLGESEQDCVERMVKLSERRPTGWLLSQGWREYRWKTKQMPSKKSLDAVLPDRPVALYSGDAHTLWLNSCALETLGVTKDSVAPAGGSYDKDEDGELTGIVRESAAMELMPRIVGSFTDDEIDDAYRGFLSRIAEQGITGVCDMSLMAHEGLDFVRDDVFARLLSRDELTARVNMFPTLLEKMDRLESMQEKYRDPLLQAPGFKQFFDGVSSQHTAWLEKPYTNARFDGDCGRPTIDPDLMRKYVLAAAEAGYPVRIHTIGDEAIHVALDIFEEAREKFGPLPDGKRNCLEHLENFQPEDIARMSELDVVAAVQPPHITLDPGGPEKDLGEERVPYMWPFRTLLDDGAVLAFGTDSPVVNVRSMDMLYAAVTRQDPTSHEPAGGWLPEQKVTMAEALRAYSLGSATAAGRGSELGTIEAGKFADITVVDKNLLACREDEILETKALATFSGGRCVFER